MQRIFKYGGIQNIILTPDKELNILIYRMPSYVMYVSYKKLCLKLCTSKNGPVFLAHHVSIIYSCNVQLSYHRRQLQTGYHIS